VAFFAALALLAATAVSLETWYNLRQQLGPEALEQARTRWRERGPADYDLKYTVARQGRSGERLLARVRGAKVETVEADGLPLEPDLAAFRDLAPLFAELEQAPQERPDAARREVTAVAPERSTRTYLVHVRQGKPVLAWCDGRAVPSALAEDYTMAALFAGVARLLERDRAAGGWRPYAVAAFDRDDGRLLHYVRSLMRTRERVEYNLLELKPVSDNGPAQAPSPP
jgi:hypothetical protein